jgi:aminoglycoside phosphotransferase (APT) family kinase protein
MPSGDQTKRLEPAADIPSVVDSVISAGKSSVKRLGAEEIRRFMTHQPTIKGEVSMGELRGAGAVGASSGIVLFTATYDEGQGRVTRELVLRHAPGSDTRLYVEYDLSRQFTVQRALQGSGVPVAKPLWLDADGRWLGVPGYIMECKRGVAPHPSAFTRGPLAEASAAVRAQMIDEVMHALVKIHQTDLEARGLSGFLMNASGDSPFRRCINWYWRTWEWARPSVYDRLVPSHRWLLEEAPNGRPELMHGDATLHNYLFHEGHLVGVVDWEMSCLGRAEADLALQCVTNEIFAAPPNSGLLQPPSEAEWLALYRKAGGRPMRDFEYYKKFAAYMIVVAVYSLQRNLTKEASAAQEPLLRLLWAILES